MKRGLTLGRCWLWRWWCLSWPLALVVPVVAGAVARVGDGSTAAQCQSGHSCGGAPVAAMCQSGYSCGGRQVAVWPLPGTNAMCQSGAACGG